MRLVSISRSRCARAAAWSAASPRQPLPGKFSGHRELMELFADQAAIAVENARLHAQTEAARRARDGERAAAPQVDVRTRAAVDPRRAVSAGPGAGPPRLRGHRPLAGDARPAAAPRRGGRDRLPVSSSARAHGQEGGRARSRLGRRRRSRSSPRTAPPSPRRCSRRSSATKGRSPAPTAREGSSRGGRRHALPRRDRRWTSRCSASSCVLQEGVPPRRRRGPIKIDVRILSATNADLAAAEGRLVPRGSLPAQVMSVACRRCASGAATSPRSSPTSRARGGENGRPRRS